jgi:beta-lactamase superfamily II metal-dependent hydrolase
MSRASWFLRMRVGYAPRNGLLASLALALLSSAWAFASPESKKPLHIFFVDVEGGQATLFVTPDQRALPIDTGWPGSNGRDADRIVAVAGKAGISKIDEVLISHFHNDHVGGLPQLVARIPVGTVIDDGDNRESTDAPLCRSGKPNSFLTQRGRTQPTIWNQMLGRTAALKSSIPAPKTPSAIQHPRSHSRRGEERRGESIQDRSH